MGYLFKGTLCGRLCDDCEENLSNVVVKLYRLREDQQRTILATASPKNTFAILSGKEVAAKEDFLIAETETDAKGNFQFELGENQDYEGEAFEIDVYVERAPGQEERPNDTEPVQFTITALQPQWRQTKEGLVAAWDHCISHRFWCRIRELLGAYVICGRVVGCESQRPLRNREVFAYDADWIEDDELGSGITDSNGRFKIYYSRDDFEQTPLSPIIDVELIGGPDLYFKIASGGSFVLEEPREKGRESRRENAGACFCIELCAPGEGAIPPEDPLFTHIGDFHVLSDIDNSNGLTNKEVLGHGGPGFGFHGSLNLYGYCPYQFPDETGEPMRYRFLYEDTVNDPGNEVPITGNLVSNIKVGSRWIQWDLDGTGPTWTFQSVHIKGSGATPGDPTPTPTPPSGTPWGPVPNHVIVPDETEGWIEVDDDAVGNGFLTLLSFDTAEIASWSPVPDDGPGNAVSNPQNGIDIKLIFEAEPVDETAATPSNSFREVVDKVHINNYKEVSKLTLEQFTGPGANSCTPLSDELNILYTTDHELMRNWHLDISSAASIPPHTLPSHTNPDGGTNTVRGGFGNKFLDISSWPSCSYTVKLTTRRKLTNGEEDDDGDTLPVTFCK